MSEVIINRLRRAMASAPGITVELPKAFITEVLEAMVTVTPAVDLDALVRKQREWNDQVIAEYLRSRNASQVKPGRARTECVECGAKMVILNKSVYGRRMQCSGCNRRVTVTDELQPEKA